MSRYYQTLVDPMLPWDPYPGENNRLRFLLALMLLLALLIIIVVNVIKIPVLDRGKAEAVPENLATVMLEQKKVPPPPPPVKPAEKPKEDKTEAKTEDKPKVKEEVPPVEKEEPKPVQMDAKTEAARNRAHEALQNSGVADQLADLRQQMTTMNDVTADGDNTPLVGNTQENTSSRNLITAKGSGYAAPAGSGGRMSSGYGEPGAGGGHGGHGSKYDVAHGDAASKGLKDSIARGGDKLASAPHATNKDGKSLRTQEDIDRVFDENSGHLNNAFQRALRDNPNLAGDMVIKLTIAPDGSVSSCEVVSSQLNDPDLESKIKSMVHAFHFPAGEFAPWSGTHKVNFVVS